MSIYVNSWSLCSWMLLSHLQHLSSFLLAPLLERWCSKEWCWQQLIKRWSAKEKSQRKEKMLFIIYYYLLIFILIIPVAWDLFSIDLGPGITSQWDAKNYGQEIVEIQKEKEKTELKNSCCPFCPVNMDRDWLPRNSRQEKETNSAAPRSFVCRQRKEGRKKERTNLVKARNIR